MTLTSNHGHADPVRAVAPNALLARAGLIRLAADGAVAEWDARVHPAAHIRATHEWLEGLRPPPEP